MIGISAYAGSQFHAAKQQPPHLKAIFPYDPYRTRMAGFETYPGGVIHVFLYLLDQLNVTHMVRGRPGPLPPEVGTAVAGGDEQPGLQDVRQPV